VRNYCDILQFKALAPIIRSHKINFWLFLFDSDDTFNKVKHTIAWRAIVVRVETIIREVGDDLVIDSDM
jgi:hypothetical protein